MKPIIFLLFLFCCCTSPALSQEVVAAAGLDGNANGYSASWTVGEVAITTLLADTMYLTQGFQQSNLIVSPQTGLQMLDLELSVFPNPTSSKVYIELDKYPENMSYAIYNGLGSLIEQRTIASSRTVINFSTYANGQYLLHLTRNFNEPVQTFKIIKR